MERTPQEPFEELTSSAEPGVRETLTRLALVYADIDEMAHAADNSQHHDEEMLWIYDFTDMSELDRPFRTGLMLCRDFSMAMLLPGLSATEVCVRAPLYTASFQEGDDQRNIITNAQTIAFQLEYLHAAIEKKQATAVIHPPK